MTHGLLSQNLEATSQESRCGFQIYSSEARDKIVEFLGWCQPTKGASDFNGPKQLRDCCDAASKERNGSADTIRLSVMSAFHFDFKLALTFMSDAQDAFSKKDETNRKIYQNVLSSLKEME